MGAIALAVMCFVILQFTRGSPEWLEALLLSVWVSIPLAFALSRQAFPLPARAAQSCRPALQDPAEFLRLLRRERLRANRSNAPLSIVVFGFHDERNPELASSRAEAFFSSLRTRIRETDIPGLLGRGDVALLLTHTDAGERDASVRRLLDGAATAPHSVRAATYPDHLFESVLPDPPCSIESSPFFLDASAGERRSGYPAKRLVDIVGASLAIVVFMPLMLLTALAIKLTSPGPVIFRQFRLGAGGTPFVFLKFRSMTEDADDQVHRDYVARLIKGGAGEANLGDAQTPLYKLNSDPRVTTIGKIIRKTSIDELPQLFNVLRGDMSLVGPRPPLPYEVAQYQPWHFRRIFEVKPGITGLWQVKGRGRTSFDDTVRLDLEYIEKCSLGTDIKILLATVVVVVRCIGAM